MSQPLRSLLFVPADDERKIAKAIESPADLVIFDLEDSVALSRKSVARETLRQCLPNAKPRPFAVRVNAHETPEHLHDVVFAVNVGADYIVLPKCSNASDLARLDAQLAILECRERLSPGSIKILPLVSETAAALSGLDYRGVSQRVPALIFAAEDLSADLGVVARDTDGNFSPLLDLARRNVAIAGAMAGLAVIDTPFPDPHDPSGLERETRAAVAMGYNGKLCIHPNQISAVNDALLPSPETQLWADAVIQALEGVADRGVATVDGKMVDKAHLRMATKIKAMIGAAS